MKKDKYIEIVTESGCWIWLGQCDRLGYGYVRDNYKQTRAHRYMYELYTGEIPKGMHVLHTCDVRCCVNPNHLYVGTHSDNMKDAYRRGRKSNKGRSNPNYKGYTDI